MPCISACSIASAGDVSVARKYRHHFSAFGAIVQSAMKTPSEENTGEEVSATNSRSESGKPLGM
jgi:hypothetical protein